MNLETILCPTDFSERCLAMAEHALGVARRFDAKLLLVHVTEASRQGRGEYRRSKLTTEPEPDETQAAGEQMGNFVQRLGNPKTVETVLKHGDVAVEIVELAHERHVDMIMMPTWGHGPYRRFILGSITAKVLHDVSCPVVTGRHDDKAAPVRPLPYRRIACAVDLGEHSREVLEWACSFAKAWDAELTVIHAAPWVGVEGSSLEHLPAELREFVVNQVAESLDTLLEQVGCEAATRVASAEAVKYADTVVEEIEADILVIGRSRRIEGVYGRLRSHAYSLIQTAPCPVVSI